MIYVWDTCTVNIFLQSAAYLFSSMFSSGSLIVLAFTFRSMIHKSPEKKKTQKNILK